jgi:hypothetical protein
VPAAVDATASPDGRVIVVLAPHVVSVMAVDHGRLRRLGAEIPLAGDNVVMLEWAHGANAVRWDGVLSGLPRFDVGR